MRAGAQLRSSHARLSSTAPETADAPGDGGAATGKRPIGDARKETSAMFAISVDSRPEVDAMVKKALAAGATRAGEPQDHGFM